MKKVGVYLLVCLFVVGLVGSMASVSQATASLGGDNVSIRAVVGGSGQYNIQVGVQLPDGDPYWEDIPA